MMWFENAAQYMHLSPLELAFTLMTRSGRVSYEDLKTSAIRSSSVQYESASIRG